MNEFATPSTEDMFEADVDSGTKDGTYGATCIGLERKTSKQGNPMWVWNFELDDSGVRIYMHTVISPAGAWKITQIANGLKLPQKDGKIKCGISDIIGKTCQVEVVNDDSYDGTPRPKIEKVFASTVDGGDDIPF